MKKNPGSNGSSIAPINYVLFFFPTDLMQVNSQLLEAIQQKVELSQQLDQWQVDMHELLEEQMVKKMRDENPKSNNSRKLQIGSGNNSDSADSGEIRKKSSKILSFFQRSS